MRTVSREVFQDASLRCSGDQSLTLKESARPRFMVMSNPTPAKMGDGDPSQGSRCRLLASVRKDRRCSDLSGP
ncbi:hypothetical protein PHBOTO_000734 [Pseudozyma hubeiensis]|nr:hypothetical protein PHBOTO_000734 [Pseudozyma hubeiensis]